MYVRGGRQDLILQKIIEKRIFENFVFAGLPFRRSNLRTSAMLMHLAIISGEILSKASLHPLSNPKMHVFGRVSRF